MVELQPIGPRQHVDEGSELHMAHMPDLRVGVQGKVAVIAHNGGIGHRDGATAAGVAIGVAEGPHLM